MKYLETAFTITILGLTTGAQAEGTDRYLASISQATMASGFVESSHPYFDWLREGEDDTLEIFLDRDTEWKIIGACDNDCSDLDFVLIDDNGYEIASDTSGDDTPYVSVIPKWSATFELRVSMYACSVNPCEYGVALFRK